MTASSAKDSCEFEPDNTFFDNFLDGMDILIDTSGNLHDEDRLGNFDGGDDSSDTDRMVIDLSSTPERNQARETKNSQDSEEATALLTNRILTYLEKVLLHHRINSNDNSFPTNQLAVDVLDRLKKFVEQKTDQPLSSSGVCTQTIPINKRGEINFHPKNNDHKTFLSDESGSRKNKNVGKNKRNSNETLKKILKLICSQEEKLSKNQSSIRVADLYADDTVGTQGRKRTNKHKRHQSKSSSKSRRRVKISRRHRHCRKKSAKSPSGGDVSDTGDKDLSLDHSLESVSSAEDDDILNRMSDEENNAESKNPEHAEQSILDREEGEVLSSGSGNDWESPPKFRRKTKIRREEFSSPHSWSSAGSHSQRYKIQRSRSPPVPYRLRHDEPERLIHRSRSPISRCRVNPWTEPERRIRIVERRSPILVRSGSPVIHLRPRSPVRERVTGDVPSYVDSCGRLLGAFQHRGSEYHLGFQPRRLSPEVVREGHRMFNPFLPTDVSKEALSCPALFRVDRNAPSDQIQDSNIEQHGKTSILLRCLQEIRHQSSKPGRFVSDLSPQRISATNHKNALGPYSSPLRLTCLHSPRLKFSTPEIREVGTNTCIATNDVACQTEESNFHEITPKIIKENYKLSKK